MSLDTPTAARSRARLLTHTLTVERDGDQVASAAGRVVPIGSAGGAYAPVAWPVEGLAGLRSSHLGLMEGTVDVVNGDEVHDGATIYYVQGVTAWEGLTACALERTR